MAPCLGWERWIHVGRRRYRAENSSQSSDTGKGVGLGFSQRFKILTKTWKLCFTRFRRHFPGFAESDNCHRIMAQRLSNLSWQCFTYLAGQREHQQLSTATITDCAISLWFEKTAERSKGISEEPMWVKALPPQPHHPAHSPPERLLLHTHNFSLLFIFSFKHSKQELTLAAFPELWSVWADKILITHQKKLP